MGDDEDGGVEPVVEIVNEPENLGLLALMLLQDSRRNARVDSRTTDLITLEEQDRTLWDQSEIEEGLRLVDQALRRRQPGAYQLQAAIAAIHAQARTPEETDWQEIAALYQELYRLSPTIVVALNHAVAVAMSQGFARGLSLIDELSASAGSKPAGAFTDSSNSTFRRQWINGRSIAKRRQNHAGHRLHARRRIR